MPGRCRQAPRWMQPLCLEWFFRLLVEPKRLWKRYLAEQPEVSRVAVPAGAGIEGSTRRSHEASAGMRGGRVHRQPSGQRLKAEGFWVRGVDLKRPEFADTAADEFVLGDLRDPRCRARGRSTAFDEVYQLAADMGGAGYIFTGEHDADVMHNSATINLNMLERGPRAGRQAVLLFVVGLHLSGTQPG